MKIENISPVQIKDTAKLIGIINSFREVLESITTMPLYGQYTFPSRIELTEYQRLREILKSQKIPFDTAKYDKMIAQSTLGLNQTPLLKHDKPISPYGRAAA